MEIGAHRSFSAEVPDIESSRLRRDGEERLQEARCRGRGRGHAEGQGEGGARTAKQRGTGQG